MAAKLPSLPELSSSLAGLAAACTDPGGEKWLNRTAAWLQHVRSAE